MVLLPFLLYAVACLLAVYFGCKASMDAAMWWAQVPYILGIPLIIYSGVYSEAIAKAIGF